MRTTHQNQGGLAGPAEVSRLGRFLNKNALVKLALDAVQTLDWSNPDLINKGTRSYQPRMMMTLLTYCYTVGRYGSQDIEQATRTDPTVRYVCAREYPDERAVRHFRRYNRPLIQHCLAYVLQQLWNLKMGAGGADFQGVEGREIEPNRHVEAEVNNRLEIASFTDLMEQED
jgi:Transposase domain (DUF772)